MLFYNHYLYKNNLVVLPKRVTSMNTDLLIKNIKSRCEYLGIAPTNACKDSGAGKSFISDLKRGQVPSAERLQKLSTFLKCTTSELLGELKEDLAVTFYDVPPQDTIREVFEIAERMVPLSISGLKNIVQDSPTSELPGPYTLSLKAELSRTTESEAIYPTKKEPTPVSGSEPIDPLTAQLMEFVHHLTPDQKKFLLAQMKTMLENQ